MQVDTDVEVRLVLPVASPGCGRPEVSCRGRVVRTISPSDREPWPGSAIVIDDYNFMLLSADAEFLSSSGL